MSYTLENRRRMMMGCWILSANTIQAISTAFGSDAADIINAIKSHLYSLSLRKAYTLAKYINEDPLSWARIFVYANGIETMVQNYTHLEYVSADGRQYIKNFLDYYNGDYPTIELKAMAYTKSYKTNYDNIATGEYLYVSNIMHRMDISFSSNNSKATMRIGKTNDMTIIPVDIDSAVPHTYLINSDEGTFVDGELKSTIYRAIEVDMPNFPLFTRHPGNAALDNETFGGRIYFARYERNGATVRCMMPCERKSDSRAGMYDIVNNQFFPSNGTANFGKGAKLS